MPPQASGSESEEEMEVPRDNYSPLSRRKRDLMIMIRLLN
ncbi:hypothetical protein CDAR_500801, partial [Caerostris darwini]